MADVSWKFMDSQGLLFHTFPNLEHELPVTKDKLYGEKKKEMKEKKKTIPKL
jgi:hypothetical protein